MSEAGSNLNMNGMSGDDATEIVPGGDLEHYLDIAMGKYAIRGGQLVLVELGGQPASLAVDEGAPPTSSSGGQMVH